MRSWAVFTCCAPTSNWPGMCKRHLPWPWPCAPLTEVAPLNPFHTHRSLQPPSSTMTLQSMRLILGFLLGRFTLESNQLISSFSKIIDRRCRFSYKGRSIFGLPSLYIILLIWSLRSPRSANQLANEKRKCW